MSEYSVTQVDIAAADDLRSRQCPHTTNPLQRAIACRLCVKEAFALHRYRSLRRTRLYRLAWRRANGDREGWRLRAVNAEARAEERS